MWTAELPLNMPIRLAVDLRGQLAVPSAGLHLPNSELLHASSSGWNTVGSVVLTLSASVCATAFLCLLFTHLDKGRIWHRHNSPL